MSTDCCDYGCTRAPNCPAGSKDSMSYEFWPGSVVAEKLLSGTDWEIEPLYWQEYGHVEAKRVQDVYERTQAAWNKQARNEVEANMQMQAFKPPFVRYDDIKPAGLSVRQVLVGCGVFLVVCVAGFSALVYFYR